MSEHTLECPCCGDEGAISEGEMFYDGQTLICGCDGWVSVGEDDVYIVISDDGCPPHAPCKKGLPA